MSGPNKVVENETTRLRKEVRLLREEGSVKKTVLGLGTPVRVRNILCYRRRRRAVAVRLLEVPPLSGTPLKNVAHGLMRT